MSLIKKKIFDLQFKDGIEGFWMSGGDVKS